MSDKLKVTLAILASITVLSVQLTNTYFKYHTTKGPSIASDEATVEKVKLAEVKSSSNNKSKTEAKKEAKKQAEKKVKKQENKYIPSKSYYVKGKKYKTLNSKQAKNITQVGLASWYGPGFHGKKTANGEIYNQNALTAAHKTLPLSTKIKVTNLENNKSIVLRVNDRGPYHGNRILDLSKEAARMLGVLEKGTAKIMLQVL